MTWQTVAARSCLNWKLVKFAEGEEEFDEEWLSLSGSEVKGLEHQFAQRQRDMSVAMRAAKVDGKSSRSRGGTGRTSSRFEEDGARRGPRDVRRSEKNETEEEKAKRMATVECYACNNLGVLEYGVLLNFTFLRIFIQATLRGPVLTRRGPRGIVEMTDLRVEGVMDF